MWKKTKNTIFALLLTSILILSVAALFTSVIIILNQGTIKAQSGPEDPLEAWSENSYIVWQYNSTYYACRNMSTLLVDYSNASDDLVIQYPIDILTANYGGTVYVKCPTYTGTYNANVTLKNLVTLVIEQGALGITVTIDTNATATLLDYAHFEFKHWDLGVLTSFAESFVNPSAFTYNIIQSGDDYIAYNGTTGLEAYRGTNASDVIQDAINDVGTFECGTIKCMGQIDINNTIVFDGDNVLGLTFEFDRIDIATNETVFNIKDFSQSIGLTLRGQYIKPANGYSGTAVLVEGTCKYILIDIDRIYIDSGVSGTAIKYSAGDGTGILGNILYVRRINGFTTGLHLQTSGSGWIGNNDFTVSMLDALDYGIRLEQTGTGSIFANHFINCKENSPGSDSGNVGRGIWASSQVAGKVVNNIFTNYQCFDLHYSPAGSLAYNADANVSGTLFIGGMLFLNSTYWSDGGTGTTIIGNWLPDYYREWLFDGTIKVGETEAQNNDWIAHSLLVQPTAVFCNLLENDALYIAQAQNSNSTHFQLYLYFVNGTAVTTNKTIYWLAWYQPNY